jgi:aryl-alcohol dehydrogenase
MAARIAGCDPIIAADRLPSRLALARELGASCILVGSAHAGTEVSFEMLRLQGGRIVRGVIQGDGRPRDFIPRLVDLFMAGRMPLDRLITRYDLADINRAAADATSGAAIKPVPLLPQ